MDKSKKRKKPNRVARMEKKKEHINSWREGFEYCYPLAFRDGYKQALRDKGLKE